MRKSSFVQARDGAIIFAIIAALLAILKPALVAAQSTGVGQPCIQNLYKLRLTVVSYAQDYDEQLPLFGQPLLLSYGLNPYAHPTSAAYLLRCPVMQRPYTLNTAISAKSLGELSGSETTTFIAQDSVPHTDGKSAIVYLDGTVTYGGVDAADPNVSCLSNAKRVAFAVLEYTQDYDEAFPKYSTYAQFQNQLLPYTNTGKIFTCPTTDQPYVTNKSLSGKSLAVIPSPGATKLLQDARPHPDGKITTAYVDGHAVQVGQ